MAWHENKIQKSNVKTKVIPTIFLSLFAYLIIKSLTNSLFFNHPDRLNILFYGKDTRYYSIGLDDSVDYFIPFEPDLTVVVSGGYGNYRVGGIGKLVELEKKPEIFKKTWSLNTASFVTRYFYPHPQEIYFGNKKPQKYSAPLPWEIIFDKSDASLFDRLYLFTLFTGKTGYSFKNIVDLPTIKNINSPLLSAEDFFKRYVGYFYESTYRNENKTVQIKYTKRFKTAQFISSILEGEGIRVVDLTEATSDQKGCLVSENSLNFSETAKAISQFFHCRLEKGKTELSDIMVTLGTTENDWEVE